MFVHVSWILVIALLKPHHGFPLLSATAPHDLSAQQLWALPSRPHLLPLLCPFHADPVTQTVISCSPPPRVACTSGLVFFLPQYFPRPLVWLASSNPSGLSYIFPLREALQSNSSKGNFTLPTPTPLILLPGFCSFLTQHLTTICTYLVVWFIACCYNWNLSFTCFLVST